MKTLVVAVAALFLTASSALAADAPMTPDEKAKTDRAAERGKLIYDYDQAAWHSTDTMLQGLAKDRLSEIRGWVVEPAVTPGELFVTYYGFRDTEPYAVYVATTRNGAVVNAGPRTGDTSLSARAKQMVRARAVALSQPLERCGRQKPNAVVVPPASEGGPVEVYVLIPQMKQGVYPFGGHHLLTVAADGTVASSRPFTRSACMDMEQPPAKEGYKPVAMSISHLLDPVPTEIHVFLSLWMNLGVYVATAEPQQIWEVNGSAITKLNVPAQPPKPVTPR